METLNVENKKSIFIDNSYLSITAIIIAETEKAVHLLNEENGKSAWMPKSALIRRKRDNEYSPNYIIAKWFKGNISHERLLGEAA